jgi:hypothetical protein
VRCTGQGAEVAAAPPLHFIDDLQVSLGVIPQQISMTPEEVFVEFRSRIVGHTVRERRLATNSLLVYIDAEPGDGTGLTLWFDPTWHLRDDAHVLTGSRQAQHDPDAADPDAGFHLVADAVDHLVGRTVVTLEMSDSTGDLTLSLDGGLRLCTFVSDPLTEQLWHIRDNATKHRLVRSGQSLAIRAPEV